MSLRKDLQSRYSNPKAALAALHLKMNTALVLPDHRVVRCPVCCDTAWVEVEAEGRSTVGRCPAGCLPRPVKRVEAPKLEAIEDYEFS